MTASRHSSGHTCTQKMPDCITSQGQGAPGKNGSPGSNHPCRPAHRLGIINYICTKGKWWASLMSRSACDSQQSNLPWSPQDAYCRRSCTWISKFTLLNQAQCTSWILVHSPWWRIKPLNYLQQPLWQVPFPASLLWSGLLHKTSSRRRWTSSSKSALDVLELPMTSPCTWLYWGRTQCPSVEPHVGSPQVWMLCSIHRRHACKGPSHKLLWLPVWCQWCPPRTQRRSMLCMLSQHPQMSLNSKSSSAWWHTSAPLSMACPLWLLLCMRTPEKRCQLHLECQLWGCFSASQASCHQQHHPQILWPITACDHTSQCLTGRPWCSTSTK